MKIVFICLEIIVCIFLLPFNAYAQANITNSTKKLGECKNSQDLPLCLLKYTISTTEPNYFIPVEIELMKQYWHCLVLKKVKKK